MKRSQDIADAYEAGVPIDLERTKNYVDKRKILKTAAKKGDLSMIKEMGKNERLYVLCKYGDSRIIEYVINEVINSEYCEDEILTCAEYVCYGGHMDIYNKIVANNRKTSEKNISHLYRCIYYACKGGKREYMKIINYVLEKIKGFTRVNPLDHGLCGACRGGNMKIVRMMIEKGAKDWNLGLINACKGGHMEIVQLMIKKGATDWGYGMEGACKGGNIEIVRLMMNKGAVIWRTLNLDKEFVYACQYGHIEIIDMLINEGVDITIRKEYPLFVKKYLSLRFSQLLQQNGYN